MIYINEWLPNPVGADAAGEFIELYNSGVSREHLTGWIVKNESGKKFSLNGLSVPPRGYLVIKKSQTKLTLRNADGGLFLYAPGSTAGSIPADSVEFRGVAPEGKSFSRANYNTGPASHFAFAMPSPGGPNSFTPIRIVSRAYQEGVPLNRQFTILDFLAIMVGTAALITGLIIYVIRHHEDLSKLFFGGNKKIWREIW